MPSRNSTKERHRKLSDEDPLAIHCFCGRPDNAEPSMIACDQCEKWYHPSCIGFETNFDDMDDMTWFCKDCETS